jgi:hypothetical protein
MSWQKDVTQQQIAEWIQLCNRMPGQCPMLYNWSSGRTIAGPDTNNPVTHDFCASMDFRSQEDYAQFDEHPYHQLVYAEAIKIVAVERVANINMMVEAAPVRTES